MNRKFALKAFPAFKTRKVCDFDHTVLEFVRLLNTFVLLIRLNSYLHYTVAESVSGTRKIQFGSFSYFLG